MSPAIWKRRLGGRLRTIIRGSRRVSTGAFRRRRKRHIGVVGELAQAARDEVASDQARSMKPQPAAVATPLYAPKKPEAQAAAPGGRPPALQGARCDAPGERRSSMDEFMRCEDTASSFAERVARRIETADKAELGRLQGDLQRWASDAALSLSNGATQADDAAFLRWSKLDHELSNAINAPSSGVDAGLDFARIATGHAHAATVEAAVAGLPKAEADNIRARAAEARKQALVQQRAAKDNAVIVPLLERAAVTRVAKPPDGNCLYHSFLHGLPATPARTPAALRRELRDKLGSLPADVGERIFGSDKAQAEADRTRVYARVVSGLAAGPVPSYAWGEDQEIALLAFVHQKDVVCFSAQGATVFKADGTRCQYAPADVPPGIVDGCIAIVHQGSHFDAVDTTGLRLRKLASSMPVVPFALAVNAADPEDFDARALKLPESLRVLAGSLNYLQRNAERFGPLSEHRLVAGSPTALRQNERWQAELLARLEREPDPAARAGISQEIEELHARHDGLLVDKQMMLAAVALPAQFVARFKEVFAALEKASSLPPGPRRDLQIKRVLDEMRAEIDSTEKRLTKAVAELDRIIGSDVHSRKQLKQDKKEDNSIHDPQMHRLAQGLRTHLRSVQGSLPAVWKPLNEFLDGASADLPAAALAMAKHPGAETTV
ncbi:hypothetical protein [Ramlibacter albus]|uniref:OTU domain-containing protein n=1 Tax=Ramlibacter albus TaxID=2079448 RepID=A0A923MF55_9BURK|nr:hypothetical protein [Ramlibacter albus]MBC5768309.1 hypothetical protein [Ramlibacter albus]